MAAPQAAARPPVVLRLACSGQTHRLVVHGSALVATDHDVAGERALAALGGALPPCLALGELAHLGWPHRELLRLVGALAADDLDALRQLRWYAEIDVRTRGVTEVSALRARLFALLLDLDPAGRRAVAVHLLESRFALAHPRVRAVVVSMDPASPRRALQQLESLPPGPLRGPWALEDLRRLWCRGIPPSTRAEDPRVESLLARVPDGATRLALVDSLRPVSAAAVALANRLVEARLVVAGPEGLHRRAR